MIKCILDRKIKISREWYEDETVSILQGSSKSQVQIKQKTKSEETVKLRGRETLNAMNQKQDRCVTITERGSAIGLPKSRSQ